LADGYTVFGIDNLNEAYDTRLKRWRLDKIKGHLHFQLPGSMRKCNAWSGGLRAGTLGGYGKRRQAVGA